MAEHLFIRISEAADQATLLVLNADGQRLHGPERVELAMAAARADGRQITVLLPADDMVQALAKLPAANPAKLRQMLPYSLEDEFAGDIDDLHFAAGERNDDDRLAVSVIAHDRLVFWQQALATAGIQPRRICSEADGVPDTPGATTLFLEGTKVLGRRSGGAPFAFDGLHLTDLFTLLREEREDGADLDNVVLFADPTTGQARRIEIEALRAEVEHLNVRELPEGVFPKLASELTHRAGTNLLQGEYAPRSNFRGLVGPWRTAAGFALAFLAFSVLAKGVELIKLGRDEARLASEATTICAQSYGSDRLTTCLAEMGRRLASYGETASGGGEGFLSMMAVVAGALDATLEVNQINYRDDVMTLDLTAQNASILEPFQARLEQGERYAVEPQSTTQAPDGRTRLRVRIVALNP